MAHFNTVGDFKVGVLGLCGYFLLWRGLQEARGCYLIGLGYAGTKIVHADNSAMHYFSIL